MSHFPHIRKAVAFELQPPFIHYIHIIIINIVTIINPMPEYYSILSIIYSIIIILSLLILINHSDLTYCSIVLSPFCLPLKANLCL